ncbi:MAG: nuclear transport factor 2 family protein [Cyanobacteriota bacterium]|nr:nuclear transport factor 2 family protein [Cyanobacteriota bacterium]
MRTLPTQILHDLFAALDRKEAEQILALMSPDIVMVDEISRRWLRGKDSVARQLNTVLAAAGMVHSQLSDLQSKALGSDAFLCTGWLDQSYTLNGDELTISAPLTACLTASDDSWVVVSLHAIPLMDPPV